MRDPEAAVDVGDESDAKAGQRRGQFHHWNSSACDLELVAGVQEAIGAGSGERRRARAEHAVEDRAAAGRHRLL